MSRVALCGVSVSAVLHDLLSEVTVRQVYRNNEDQNIEAVYTFPLPLDAVLLELRVEIGGRILTGVVVEKASAERKYEDAIEAGDAAVMLEALEPGLYTLNAGNLLPKETAIVTFTYALVYRWAGDGLRMLLPTTIAPRFGASPHQPHQVPESSLIVENECSIQLEIFGCLRDAQFSCPSHAVTLTTLPDKTVIGLKAAKTVMDRDFVLNIKAPQARRNFALCGADDGGGAAIASFQPTFPGLREPRALDLAIVIDCSGSMQGNSIAQAKQALSGILSALHPRDRITIVAFGSTFKPLSDQLLTCTESNLARARAFAASLDADMGGTEIGGALKLAFAAVSPSEHADLFVITDGEVSDWESVVAQAKGYGRRVFTVGVGNAVSEAFVRGLASATGGACELVSPQEGMADRVIRHFERIRAPRAKHVTMRWPDGAHEMAPSKFSAVFDGDTVTGFAQLGSSAVAGVVGLEIETESGDVFRQEMALTGTTEPSGHMSTVARLAASARMAESDPVTGLATALRYRLVSPWTNWLVVAERPTGEKALEIPAIRKVPQTMAAGWGGVGLVGAIDMADMVMACQQSAPAGYERPERFRPLLELMESDRVWSHPSRAFDLLSKAGLLSEFEDLFELGAGLGIEQKVVAMMILADLLDGPLSEFLPRKVIKETAHLQADARDVMARLSAARDVSGRIDDFLRRFRGILGAPENTRWP